MAQTATAHHAHVYFREPERAAIARLHARAHHALAGLATVWPIRNQPVGPHLLPMFEIEFAPAQREAVTRWLEANHGSFPVLLHPVTGDDWADHQEGATWLGERLELNWAAFEPREANARLVALPR